jgi:nucleoside 2-deoxyribosyltransferase
MTVTAHLAGPDVFLPNAVEHAARKVAAICQRFGFRGLPPHACFSQCPLRADSVAKVPKRRATKFPLNDKTSGKRRSM